MRNMILGVLLAATPAAAQVAARVPVPGLNVLPRLGAAFGGVRLAVAPMPTALTMPALSPGMQAPALSAPALTPAPAPTPVQPAPAVDLLDAVAKPVGYSPLGVIRDASANETQKAVALERLFENPAPASLEAPSVSGMPAASAAPAAPGEFSRVPAWFDVSKLKFTALLPLPGGGGTAVMRYGRRDQFEMTVFAFPGDASVSFKEYPANPMGKPKRSLEASLQQAPSRAMAAQILRAVQARNPVSGKDKAALDAILASLSTLVQDRPQGLAARPAPSADTRLADLNAAVTEILKPFNDAVTQATFVFNRLELNAQRATQADVSVSFDKQGPDGKASIKVDRLAYSYPEEPAALPQTEGRFKLGFNLRNVLTQKQINKFGPQADKLVAELLSEYIGKYGDAVTLDAGVRNKRTDAEGNLTGLRLLIAVKFDLSKLPEGVDPKTIEFIEIGLDAEITLNGLEAAFNLVSNPNASSFDREQTGLKETVEQLLARDPKAMREISRMVKQIDSLAKYLTTNQVR